VLNWRQIDDSILSWAVPTRQILEIIVYWLIVVVIAQLVPRAIFKAKKRYPLVFCGTFRFARFV